MARSRTRRASVRGKLRNPKLRVKRRTRPTLERPPPSTCTNSTRRDETKPITPPQGTGVPGSYQCVVDYKQQPFKVHWLGLPEYPDFSGFPSLKNIKTSRIQQSAEMTAIWKSSILLDYGSYASIRICDDRLFPILKLSHLDEQSKILLQHEFDILLELSKLSLPIVKIDPQPILDNGVTCGYRMQQLYRLEPSELGSRARDIKDALGRLHSVGFCHGDFSPSNIMKNESGDITLIDFSFAGRIGSSIPSFFPCWVYKEGVYNHGHDLASLSKYICLD